MHFRVLQRHVSAKMTTSGGGGEEAKTLVEVPNNCQLFLVGHTNKIDKSWRGEFFMARNLLLFSGFFKSHTK